MRVMTRYCCLLVLLIALAAGAADWPGWRGATGEGVAAAGERVPLRWSATENVKWKTPLPGVGHSSPIVYGRRVFVTSAVSLDPATEKIFRPGYYSDGNRDEPDAAIHRWVVLSVDLDTGKILWEQVASERRPPSPRHTKNSYASETPVTDGRYVFAYFGAEGLFCYDYDGKLVWKRDFGPIRTRDGWGTATSPILYKDTVIITRDSEEDSFLYAVEKRTGEIKWKVPRDEKTSWSTPSVITLGGRTELIVSATNRARSYNPDTGRLYWEVGGMTGIHAPTAVTGHGLVYLSSGYRSGPIIAVRPGGHGDFTLKENESSNEFVAWSQKAGGAQITSPVVVGDYLYVLGDRGILSAYNARTGERIYQERIETGQTFSASPVVAAGRIYCASEDGDTFVFRPGPKYEVLAKNPLGEVIMASPAVVDNSFVIRTRKHLYRIAEAK